MLPTRYIQPELAAAIADSLAIDLPENLLYTQCRQRMVEKINNLIIHDFQKLVWVLYRVDVNESKLTYLLKTHKEEDAAGIIADLLIERQLQKIESRKNFRTKDKDIPDEEKW